MRRKQESYWDISKIVFNTNSFWHAKTTTVSEVILQALRTRCSDNHSYRNNTGNRKPRLWYHLWRLGIGHYADFSVSRPNPHNNQFQVVILRVTLQQFTNIPLQKQKIYIQHDSTSQEYNLYNTKVQLTAENNIASDYGQDTNWTKSLADNRWRKFPAQATPEGFPS